MLYDKKWPFFVSQKILTLIAPLILAQQHVYKFIYQNIKDYFYHHATIITSVFLNCLGFAIFSSYPTWFSCRTKQTSRICEYKMWCSNWMSLSARWWFKVAAWCLILISPWKVSVGWQREIDCDISANHQGILCTVWWKCCLVWKKPRLKGSCHSGSSGCGSGTQQQASSVSLRQQRDTDAVFWHCWSFIIEYHPRGSNHE